MKTLGLDIGTASLGWAYIDFSKNEIIACGSRIFPEGLDNLGQGDKEESKMAGRRTARGMRRQYDRKSRRKKRLANFLHQHLYWPGKDQRADFNSLDPYHLRNEALKRPLRPNELARLFYHLNQHRGFKSNGSGSTEESAKTLFGGSKDGHITGISQAAEAMQQHPTLGSYLHEIKQKADEAINSDHGTKEVTERVRARYTLRSWFEEEFDKIVEEQKKHHPEALTAQNIKELRDDIIFFQRMPDPKDYYKLVGYCTFEPDEKRIAKGHPLAEEYIIWQTINNVKVHLADKLKDKRTLTEEEQNLLFAKLIETKEISPEQAIKYLKLPGATQDWNINLTSKLKGSLFRSHLKSKLKKKYSKLSDEQVTALYEDMANMGAEEFVAHTQKTYNLTQEEAVDVQDHKAPKGYLNVSKKAIEKLLPFMQQGFRTDEAEEQAGYERRTDKAIYDPETKLDYLSRDWLIDKKEEEDGTTTTSPSVKNPVVYKGLWEMRKVVNEIIREYGKPDVIHVEMARDVKANKDKRKQLSDKMKDNETRNEDARQALDKYLKGVPTKGQVLRYNLWKEQGGKCMYSGENIPKNLILDDSRVQVDHILPYSRFKQDGYMNKVLCYAAENADKGNKTPLEWLGEGHQKLNIIEKIAKDLPEIKQEKLLMDVNEPDPDGRPRQGGFTENQLVDTSYIMRQAIEYLCTILPKQHVLGVKGKYTHELRSRWFPNKNKEKTIDGQSTRTADGKQYFLTNFLLDDLRLAPAEINSGGKTRLDHRHHALDAIVIACTSPERIKNMVT